MRLDLTVVNYILPSQSDELLIQSLDSYGELFWRNVDSHLVFKKDPSATLVEHLNKLGIKYSIAPDSLWMPTFLNLVQESKTKYILLFIEDICIMDPDKLVHTFQTLEGNNADCTPTIGLRMWHKVVDHIKNKKVQDIDSDDKFHLTYWGTRQSAYYQQPSIKETVGSHIIPYPISAPGIFKKDFLIHTAEVMMQSDYWKAIEVDPDCFTNQDWAKNPRLPHSYEVFWHHNKHLLDLEYTILIPKENNSYSNDPKDLHRDTDY